MRNILLILFLLMTRGLIHASDPYPVQKNTDILHYRFSLWLHPGSAALEGEAEITFRLHAPAKQLRLDLIGKKNETGMTVVSVTDGSVQLPFVHEQDVLTVPCQTGEQPDTILRITVRYRGVPADGLIISQNTFGQWSAFGDNWPDRARHWLPTVDHPSDKARVDFLVTTDERMQVVANGYRRSAVPAGDGLVTTCYTSTVPLPTKVMVIGISNFAVQTAGFVGDIPVESWVYAENSQEGFTDYRPAAEITGYFTRKIGPFPFEKLANVQSKTRYGGMENSGVIFYHERSVTGEDQLHRLLAHEIAHQWFGDAVTEQDWHHIWLSEGFATYLEAVCMSEYYKAYELGDHMASLRQRVVRYHDRHQAPLLDTTITDLTRLLNTNSYQKGAWVLHMLRNELGDEVFWQGISRYYKQYRHQTALTDDFRHCMEEVAGKSLYPFFSQWVYTAGHPRLLISVSPDSPEETVWLTITQTQTGPAFEFPLTVSTLDAAGQEQLRITRRMTGAEMTLELPAGVRPAQILTDPDQVLLYETTEK